MLPNALDDLTFPPKPWVGPHALPILPSSWQRWHLILISQTQDWARALAATLQCFWCLPRHFKPTETKWTKSCVYTQEKSLLHNGPTMIINCKGEEGNDLDKFSFSSLLKFWISHQNPSTCQWSSLTWIQNITTIRFIVSFSDYQNAMLFCKLVAQSSFKRGSIYGGAQGSWAAYKRRELPSKIWKS